MSDEFDPYREWLGIAPDEHPVDHYRLLGLTRFENDPQRIQQAADTRMMEVRLHQTGPRGRHTQKLLNELAAARVCLITTENKQTYDAQLTSGVSELPKVDGLSPVSPPPIPPVPPPAPMVVSTMVSAVSASSASPSADAQDESEVVRGGWWKLIVGLVAVLLIAGGIWGLGWWAGREHSANQSVTTDGAGQRKEIRENLSTEVVVNQEGTGEIGLAATVATLHGNTVRCQVNGVEGQIENWTDTADWVSWKLKVLRPGYFKAEVTYAADKDADRGTYLLQIDDESPKTCEVKSPLGTTGRTDEHYLLVKRNGTHTLSVKVDKKPGKELMKLKSIRLLPVARP